MLKWVVLTLVLVKALGCRDGVDNVVQVFDTTGGEGAILFHGVEIWTYDRHWIPACSRHAGSFQFPGKIKIAKGIIEVRERLTDHDFFQLALSLEKDSGVIGTVCDNGVSKSMFVDNQQCSYNLCDLIGHEVCHVSSAFLKGVIDLSPIASHLVFDTEPLPSSLVAIAINGDWKMSAQVLYRNTVIAGIRVVSGGLLNIGEKTHGEL